jgi:hypothetical protein
MSASPSDTPVTNPHQIFIGGAWVTPSSDSMFEVITPAAE